MWQLQLPLVFNHLVHISPGCSFRVSTKISWIPLQRRQRAEGEPLVLLKRKDLQRKCILPLKTERGKKDQFSGELFRGRVVCYRISSHFFGWGWGGWACFCLGFGGLTSFCFPLLNHLMLALFFKPARGKRWWILFLVLTISHGNSM